MGKTACSTAKKDEPQTDRHTYPGADYWPGCLGFVSIFRPPRHTWRLNSLVVSFLNLLFFHGFSHFTLSFRVRQIGEVQIYVDRQNTDHRLIFANRALTCSD